MTEDRKIQQFIQEAAAKGISQQEAREFLRAKGVISPTLATEKLSGFGSKATSPLAKITGGETLARGIGQAVSNVTGTQKKAIRGLDDLINTQGQIIKRIQENRKTGKDTSRLKQELQNISASIANLGTDIEEIGTGGLKDRQVLSSAGQLALTAGAGNIARGATNVASRVSSGVGARAGMLRGATTGAITGGAIGAGSGALNIAGEEDTGIGQIAGGALRGALGGAITGGALGGAIGGVTGRIKGAPIRKEKSIIDRITPTANELTPTEYKRALSSGRITPATRFSAEKVVLPSDVQNTAIKYQNILKSSDPAKNVISVGKEIARQDEIVGEFLKKNNAIFNKGQLRNYLLNQLDDIDDPLFDPQRLQTAKEKLVEGFIRNLPKNNMENLWKTRKLFDRSIEKAFSGSPTLAKTVKVSLRNGVQDFISQNTDNVTYASKMKDMSNLINIAKILETKAARTRGSSLIGKFLKENPTIKQALGWAAAGAAASVGLGAANRAGSSN